MFFYEWVVPMTAIVVIAGTLLYITVRNRTGAGIRTDGKVLLHKPEPDDELDRRP